MGRAPDGAAAMALLAALADGADHGIADLAARLGRSRRQVSKAAAQLARRGWILRSAGGAGIYRVTPGGLEALRSGVGVGSGPAGPNRKVKAFSDTLRGRAWLAMRVRRVFTLGEIVTDASRSGEATAQDRDNLARYIARLKDAGIIAEASARRPGTAPTSNGFKQFVLRQNTGRAAPVYRARQNVVHDPNTGKDMPCAKV